MIPDCLSRPLVLHVEASTGFGGQEIRVLNESRWLLDHGWGALLACQPASRMASEARAVGVPTLGLRMRGAFDGLALFHLYRVVPRLGVDLIHTHSSVDSWLGGIVGNTRRIPVIRSRHVSIPVKRLTVYRLADRIIASGGFIKEILERAGLAPERVVSIPAGVDPGRFSPRVSGAGIRQELGHRGSLVGLIANVRGSKGHQILLAAVPVVLATVPTARFVVVGEGVGLRDVSESVRAHGLAEYVRLLGFRRDIPEIMAALDMLVAPSLRSEGVSQVILQALAMGTPVVATNTGGTSEVILDGVTGTLVAPGDPVALASAILAVLHDPDGARRRAHAGQTIVADRYTLDRSMKATLGVYGELITAKGKIHVV
jgi:glycosyltransferase involved in cell wall biosynthesis